MRAICREMCGCNNPARKKHIFHKRAINNRPYGGCIFFVMFCRGRTPDVPYKALTTPNILHIL